MECDDFSYFSQNAVDGENDDDGDRYDDDEKPAWCRTGVCVSGRSIVTSKLRAVAMRYRISCASRLTPRPSRCTSARKMRGRNTPMHYL